MASRCFGELVRKMGDKILAIIVPSLTSAMSSDKASTRQGVCFGLKEVLEGMSREQLAEHLPAMMPAVQSALCDEDEDVRSAGGEAFSVLFRGGAGSIIDSMMPSLLEGLGVEDKAAQSLEGLRVILSVRPSLLGAVLPKLLSVSALKVRHPRACLFCIQVKLFTGSRYPSKSLFGVENKSTGQGGEKRICFQKWI